MIFVLVIEVYLKIVHANCLNESCPQHNVDAGLELLPNAGQHRRKNALGSGTESYCFIIESNRSVFPKQ